ncbi:MAG: hypothetical protein AB7F89_03205 [Pirellulaceae bacterium]
MLSLLAPAGLRAEPSQPSLPTFDTIASHVQQYFARVRDHRDFDLISRSQVAELLGQLQKLGWQPPDGPQLLERVLADQHVLVRTLRSPAGRTFLAKVASRDLIYDRLDRVSTVSGGARLIQDLVKLPDGERYAKPRSGGGVPDLLDLLPKHASGKTRKIADYDKPTGHLYTVEDLLEALRQSYDKTVTPAAPAARPKA